MQCTTRSFSIRLAMIVCASFVSEAAAQTCIEPASGMVGWWPGDGDSVDIQSGLHGVALNGAAYGPGLVGEAFAFNGFDEGRDDRVDLPASVLDGAADLTIEMWVQSEDDQGAFLSGASDEGPTFNNEMLLFQGTGSTTVIVKQEFAGPLPIMLNDGAWHHLAFTRAGALGVVYIDGSAVKAWSVPTGLLDIGPGGLMLGQEQDCLGGCFQPEQGLDGRVDELAIYDRALSEGEIVAIFDARDAGKCKPPSRADLLRELEELETEVDTLQDRITELEDAAEDTDYHPCQRSHERRGCWKHRKRTRK